MPSSGPGGTPHGQIPRGEVWYYGNLAFLLAFGVLISLWVLHYTESIEFLGGILGLGGAFAWVAFISNVIKNERKDRLQDAFDALLRKPATSAVLVVLAAGISAIWPLSTTAIIVDSSLDDIHRSATISELDQKNGQVIAPGRYESVLIPRQEQNLLVATGLFCANDYRVKLSGLPSVDVDARWLSPVELSVPASFYRRPLVLVRPSSNESTHLRASAASVELFYDGKKIDSISDYRGEAIWLGTEPDVSIPPEILENWRDDVRKEMKPDAQGNLRPDEKEVQMIVEHWLPPKGMAAGFEFQPGKSLTVRVASPDGVKDVLKKTIRIQTIGNIHDIVQDIVLDGGEP